jgi:large subunit ribosomal protein L1
MGKTGRKQVEAKKKVDRLKRYPLDEALKLVKELAHVSFDESVEVAVRLGIDAKKTDQQIRGSVVLPHGTGKELKVLVFAKGDKEVEAREAGADFVGGDEMVEKVQGGWLEFDKAVATPDMMGQVGKLGRVLGPRGLMPNPKVGTVTFEVANAVKEIKAGKVEYRTEKSGIVHAAIGRRSFEDSSLEENLRTFMETIIKAKPAASKGHYLKSVTLSTTMGPGVKLETTQFGAR